MECGIKNDTDYKFCSNCGTKNDDTSEIKESRFCPFCGFELTGDVKFCSQCGSEKFNIRPDNKFRTLSIGTSNPKLPDSLKNALILNWIIFSIGAIAALVNKSQFDAKFIFLSISFCFLMTFWVHHYLEKGCKWMRTLFTILSFFYFFSFIAVPFTIFDLAIIPINLIMLLHCYSDDTEAYLK